MTCPSVSSAFFEHMFKKNQGALAVAVHLDGDKNQITDMM